MAYGGQRPFRPALEVGSPVELVRDPMSRHGVIRWMGSLPGTRAGTMAGVELVYRYELFAYHNPPSEFCKKSCEILIRF